MPTPTPATQAPCPDESALRKFLRDELPAEEAGRVDRHLGACPACQRLLDRLIGGLPAGLIATVGESGAAAEEGPPALVGCETLGPVAEGGMGVIWRVRDLALGRDLAVKVLKLSYTGDARAIARFLAEPRITGRLAHPFIVPVHGMGRLPDGRPWYTMKLVQGRTLAELLKGRADLAAGRMELLRVFSQVCQAVAFAHQQGVIHRDLKPHNVMVGEHGEVQVMDWGLAKVLDQAQPPPAEEAGADGASAETRDDAACHTRPGSILGTYAYMPPEQARGLIDQVDRRADVFGLGAILCEVLTGSPPYVGQTDYELERQASNGELEGAYARLRTCGADTALVGLACACLAVDPAERPADAGAVAARVTAYLESVEARLRRAELERAQAEVKTAEERRRRKLWVALAATVVAALAVSLVLLALQQRAAEELQAALRNSRRTAAHAIWDRGRRLCEEGEVGHGLLLIARALETAPEGPQDADLQEALRLELASWHRFSHTLRHVLPHLDKVLAVAVSPDGKAVLTGCADGKARLWDLETGDLLGILEGHQKAVCAVAFGSNGRFVLTGSEDATACLWDVTMRRPIAKLEGHTGAVWAVAFSPDGKTALTGSADRTARLWDLPAGTPRGRPLAHPRSVLTVAFRPDGEAFLTGGENDGENEKRGLQKGEVRVWKTTTAEQVGATILRDRIVRVATFSPDGKMLLIGDDNWEGTLWDLEGQRQFAGLRHKGSILGAAFAADGKTLLTGTSISARAHLWDAARLGDLRKRWRGSVVGLREFGPSLPHPGAVTSVVFFRGGRGFVTACEDGCVRVWQKALGPLPQTELRHSQGKPLRSAVFDPRGKAVATGGDDGTVQIWDAATGTREGEPLVLGQRVRAVAFTPDGANLLADCGKDNEGDIRSWDLRTRTETRLPLPKEGEVAFETISPDGRWILTVGRDGTARRWEPTGTRPPIGPRQPARPGGINLADLGGAIIDREGRFILAGDNVGGKAQFWDAVTGEPVGKPMEHHHDITALAFSPDGHRALTGSSDRRVRVWDVPTGESLRVTLSHPSEVLAAVFSPDGRWALIGGREPVRSQLWDPRLGKPIGPRHQHPDEVLDVAFHPGGEMAVMARWEGVAVLVPIPGPMNGEVDRIVCWVRASLGMTLDEGGGLQALDGRSWLKLQERLRQLGGPP
jgi:WD40 repeat protein